MAFFNKLLVPLWACPLFERPPRGTRVLLVGVEWRGRGYPSAAQESAALAVSAGLVVAGCLQIRRGQPEARYLIGSGKAEEIKCALAAHDAALVFLDHPLAPSQQRNLEQLLNCRVLDRSELILEIFAERARSYEGKLQVELAQLQHFSTRLKRGWTHLERQQGGIGIRGGPGEKQLEIDRRLLGQRIKALNERLTRVERQRQQGRKARLKSATPTVALVGYTNTGKSTLFKRLCRTEVSARNRLFDTLDPTLRRVRLSTGLTLVLADTVGFIRELPHELIAAFRATLAEARSADLLLHVIDAESEERAQQEDAVNEVLAALGASEIPQLRLFNKIDCLGRPPSWERATEGQPDRLWISAHTGAGLDLLATALTEHLAPVSDLIAPPYVEHIPNRTVA